MGVYRIPRNVKGESRILFIFTRKSLVYTAIGLMLGLLLKFILKLFKLSFVGIIVTIICAAIGYIIGTMKVPNLSIIRATKVLAGEDLHSVILRAIKFKTKNKIYIYDNKEETKDEQY